MKQRQCIIRGKEWVLEEVTEAAAVNFDPHIRLEPTFHPFIKSQVEGRTLDEDRELLEVFPDEEAAFSLRGWMFSEATPKLRDQLTKGESPPAARAASRVFKDPCGQILLDSNRMMIRFADDVTEEEQTAFFDEKRLKPVGLIRNSKVFVQIRVLGEEDSLASSVCLEADSRVDSAEPDFIQRIGPRRWQSNAAPLQWHLFNQGQYQGLPGADINALEAWQFTGGYGINLALIDNGFEISHRDLRNAIHPQSGYFKNIDDDADTEFVPSPVGFPLNQHGTFCAGMALARGYNQYGVRGVAPHASFSAIACLADQIGTQTTLARALAYAAKPDLEDEGVYTGMGADVIACSLGPNRGEWRITSCLDLAIEFATREGRDGKGTPVFWAASNTPTSVELDEIASHPDTISVSRSTRQDHYGEAAWGPELDLVAPGVDVASTTLSHLGGYSVDLGTSFAAPCAAGVAALILSANSQLTALEVREILENSAEKIGGVPYENGKHPLFGHGRVNAGRAVRMAWAKR